MAEQFEVTQQLVAYNPEKATDFVREFDRHIAERDAMARPYEAAVRANAQYAVTDANKKVAEMQQLAKLSESLMNKLTDIQEKANEEQYAQGLADALMEGPDLVGQEQLEAEETALVSGQKVATDASNQYLAEGGSERNAREIRNTGGWYGYGRFVGQLQQLGDAYGGALEQAKADFTINVQGQEIGYDQLNSPDLYNAWQRAFNSQYLKGVPRTNGDVVEKYVLRTMRAQASSDRAKWNREHQEQIKLEEQDARQTEFIQAISRGDATIAERAFATYPGSKRQIRLEMEKNLIAGIDAGMISPNQALEFYQNQTIVKDGKTQTLQEAFPMQYNLFEDEVQKAITKEDDEYIAARTSDARELERTLAASEQLSGQQIAELKTSDRYKNNPAAQQILDRYLTREELDDVGSKAYLDDLYRNGQLTSQELSRFPKNIQAEYAGKAQQTDNIIEDYDSKEALRVARGFTRSALEQSIGETPSTDDLEFQRYEKNASAIHKETYEAARREGYDHQQAMTKAYAALENELNEHKQTGKSGFSYKPTAVNVGTKVKEAREFIKNNNNSINTQVIPGSETELKAALEHLRTGNGSMPGFYSALAAGQPYTAEDLVLKQAALAGHDVSKYVKSPYVQGRVKLPTELRRLVTVSPNPQTFAQAATRAVLGGQDTKYFLDTVASKESESYGGYDAYNLGGSAGGHVAHGSGNSAKDNRFGKPVSQLTIGEIKRLHASGQAHAMGRYQFIGSTFAEVAPMTGLSDNTVFGPKVQDLFAITRLIQRASWGNLQSGLRSEWIGLNYLNSTQYQRLVQAARGAIQENK